MENTGNYFTIHRPPKPKFLLCGAVWGSFGGLFSCACACPTREASNSICDFHVLELWIKIHSIQFNKNKKNDTHNTQHTTHNNKRSRSCTDCRDKRGRYVAERETRDEGRRTSHIARAYSIYLEHISPTSSREIPRLSSSIADTHTQPLKRKQQKNRTIPYYLPSGPIK